MVPVLFCHAALQHELLVRDSVPLFESVNFIFIVVCPLQHVTPPQFHPSAEVRNATVLPPKMPEERISPQYELG